MKLNFAEKLRTLRRGKNLTQEQLADLLAVSVQTVSRWENEITYPDVEMLPVLAELFETSVDALLGVTEALKEQQISGFWEKLNRTESSRERTDILREAHHAFPRDLSFSARLCSSILYSDAPVNNPEALYEMRTLADDVLANASDVYLREEVIHALVRAEDEERTEALLVKYASGDSMTRSSLLRYRYGYRKEFDKERYLSQQDTAQALSDHLLGGLTDPSDDPDEKIAAYRTAIAMIDTLTGCTNPNPVSGDGVPDLWCGVRIHLGNRMAAWYAQKNDREAVYEILEDNVSFFEKVCALDKGAVLTYRTPGLSLLICEADYEFTTQPNCDADYGKRLYKTLYFNPVNPPIKTHSDAFFPTTYTWALTDRECWSEFDGMRDEPRFQALADRMTSAVLWKNAE